MEVGDSVLCGMLVGVVIAVSGASITCACSDGEDHEFDEKKCSMISDYKSTLKQYMEVLKHVTR